MRGQRTVPRLRAMRRKSGVGESRLAKTRPDIAISGIAGARSWNILTDLKPRLCGTKKATIIRSNPQLPAREAGFAASGDRYFKAVAFGLLRSSNDPVEKACQFSLPTLRARIIIGEFGVYVLGASARDGLIRKALATRPYL
jgi:hypothetical protein